MKLSNGERLLHWPLAEHVITAGWTYSDWSAHNAIDFRTNQDGYIIKPVYASEDATVDQVQIWNGSSKTGMQSYGTMTRLHHDDYNGMTLQTRYAHLSSVCVSRGQKVKEGEIIGYTGQTGNVSGAHLHFEVILNGNRVNPLNWLDDNFVCANSTVKAHLGSYKSVNKPVTSNTEDTTMTENKLQKLCVVEPTDVVLARAKEAGLPMEKHTCYLIGPASNGDAMAIWEKSKSEGCEYYSSFTET